MKLTATFVLMLTLAATTGCGGTSREANYSPAVSQTSSAPNAATQDRAATAPQQGGGSAGKTETPGVQNVSLTQADASQTAPASVERKIIRNANITLEIDEPTKGMQRIASLAESRGGFVVTSESRHEAVAGGKSYEVITMQLRVPAAQFDATINEIRNAGSRVTSEKISGQDVTEEYIDLEARLRTQRALEEQLLKIMKDSNSVADALEVQRELANVRTEIERVEGRRRFLENQTSLSTISVTLQPPAPLINTKGFTRSVASAFGNGIDAASAVTLFLIQAALALLPLVLFVVLPIYLLIRFIVRRARRRAALAKRLQEQSAELARDAPAAS
jgi:hypothetical protein